MGRLGHSSPRAALIYQHATAERDAAIARALSEADSTARRADPSLVRVHQETEFADPEKLEHLVCKKVLT